MTGFELSPGITPTLVSIFSIELPLAFGLGYVLFRDRGLEAAIALNAVVLAAIKVYTDYSDFYDMLVAAAALAAGLAMGGLLVAPDRNPSRGARLVVLVVAVYAIPLGTIKILTDVYDPFDTFLGASAVIAGAILLRWALVRPPNPRS